MDAAEIPVIGLVEGEAFGAIFGSPPVGEEMVPCQGEGVTSMSVGSSSEVMVAEGMEIPPLPAFRGWNPLTYRHGSRSETAVKMKGPVVSPKQDN